MPLLSDVVGRSGTLGYGEGLPSLLLLLLLPLLSGGNVATEGLGDGLPSLVPLSDDGDGDGGGAAAAREGRKVGIEVGCMVGIWDFVGG